MTERDIGSIQRRLAGPGGVLGKYREATVGDRGYGRLVLYEAVFLAAGSLGSGLGIRLRRLLYPLILGHVGRGVDFGRDCSFLRPHLIEIGNGVILGDRVALDVKSDGAAIVIGDGVSIGGKSIFSCPGGRITIGAGTKIGARCRLGSLLGLTVGGKCTIGESTYIVGAGHASARLDRPIIDQPLTCRGPNRIGDEVVIGEGVTVLDGVSIGDGAQVEPGSLVLRDIAPGERVSGVPAAAGREREAA